MGYSKKIEALYPYLPRLLQNVLISGQGLIFRRQRFGGQFEEELERAIARANWSKARLEEQQFADLTSFLRNAYKSSPFWTKRMDECGVSLDEFETLEDLQKLPVLEKEDLRRNVDEIASVEVNETSLVSSHTSGTTGTPISVAFTTADMQARFATLYRMFDQFNVSPLERSVRFSGRTLFPNSKKSGVFWRMNLPMSQLLMSSYDLHPDNLQAYIDKVARFKPAVIDGYPSSIFVVARFINQTGQAGRITPKAIMTTAETLEDYQRDEIGRAFGGCPVINQYASSEGAPFITEDPNGDLVVNTDTGVFEFVEPGTTTPALPGTVAEMLVTSFTTHAYPLIRYRIGDTVLLPKHPRKSEFWDMPVVEKILGRQEDILYTPERGFVGRLDPVFKKSPPSIFECQIVQIGPMEIRLNVVPDESANYSLEHLVGIKEELRLRLGNVKITVHECESLPRGKNGKLRAVVGLSKDGSANLENTQHEGDTL